jgi:pantothenate kinase
VDDSWFVDVEERLARGRIAKRHVKSGIETSWEAAVRRAEGNDLVNGRIIRQKLVRPAVTVQSVEE